MKLRKNKKGFTIVELVIVIAVIGVLAAVLIPTFVNLTDKANKAADDSLVKNLNTALATQEGVPGDTKNNTLHDAIVELEEYGFKMTNFVTKASENNLLWNQETNRFLLEKNIGEEKNKDRKYEFWKIQDSIEESQEYSVYAGNNFNEPDGGVTVSVGFDAGFKSISKVTYNNSSLGSTDKIVIRTNGGMLQVGVNDSEVATGKIFHYGTLDNAIVYTTSNSFHTHGKIGNMQLHKGKAVAEDKGYVALIEAAAGTEIEEVDTGMFYIPSDATTSTVDADVASTIGYTVTTTGSTPDEERTAKIAATPYTIANKFDFIAFRNSVNAGNTFNNITVSLVEDVDLENEPWTPVGDKINNVTYKFSGTFDGQGYSIKGLFINGGKYKSLFGYGESATFKNFTVEGYASGENVSGVCARIIGVGNCRFENIVNKVNIDTSAYNKTSGTAVYVTGKAGGFTAYVDAGHSYYINCVNYGNVRINSANTGTYTAGLVAGTSLNVSLTFKGCANYGTISNGFLSGGLVARFCNGSGALTIGGDAEEDYCYNYGSISSNGLRGCATGGLVGEVSDGQDGVKPGVTVSIKNCFNKLNNQNDNTIDGGVAGGIAGAVEAVVVDIINCRNEVPVSGCNVGGIVGAVAKKLPDGAGTTISSPYILIENCVNTNTVTGNALYEHPSGTGQGSWSNVTSGGVVGIVNSNSIRITLRNCQGGAATIQNTVTPDSTKVTYFSASGRLIGLVNGSDTHLELTSENNDTSNHLSMVGYACIAASGGGGPATIYIDSGTLVGDFNMKAQIFTMNFAAGTSWHKAAEVTVNYESATQEVYNGAHTSAW